MADNNRDLDSARKGWEERKLKPALKRGKERREKFETSSGIEVKRAYDPDDLNGFEYLRDLGFPGEFPPLIAGSRLIPIHKVCSTPPGPPAAGSGKFWGANPKRPASRPANCV